MSSIEWVRGDDGTDGATWNPVIGCSRVSPGCGDGTGGGCYAERMAHRLSTMPHTRERYAGITRVNEHAKVRWTGVVRPVPEKLSEPLHWKKPRRIFVNSMSDLFHEDVPEVFIDHVFAVMALARRHTYQVLTKRAERMRAYLAADSVDEPSVSGRQALNVRLSAVARTIDPKGWEALGGHTFHWHPERWPWCWLGVSVENQKYADERVAILRRTAAAVRFLSVEPMIGPIDFGDRLTEIVCSSGQHEGGNGYASNPMQCRCGSGVLSRRPVIHWAIAGFESGPGARRGDVAWIRSFLRQMRAAGIPPFVKQLGANTITRNDDNFTIDGQPDYWPGDLWAGDRIEEDLDGTRDGYQGAPVRVRLRHPKGGDPEEWPEDLRVREFPRIGGTP